MDAWAYKGGKAPVVSMKHGTPNRLAAGMAKGLVSITDTRSGQVAGNWRVHQS